LLKTFEVMSAMMEPIQSIKVPNFDSFIKVCDLIFYDGPLLSHFKSPAKKDYLFYWVDVNDGINKWIVVPVTEYSIKQYLLKTISLKQLILSSEDGIAYSVDTNHMINYKNAFTFSLDDIDPEYLPEEDSFFDYEINEYYQLTLLSENPKKF